MTDGVVQARWCSSWWFEDVRSPICNDPLWLDKIRQYEALGHGEIWEAKTHPLFFKGAHGFVVVADDSIFIWEAFRWQSWFEIICRCNMLKIQESEVWRHAYQLGRIIHRRHRPAGIEDTFFKADIEAVKKAWRKKPVSGWVRSWFRIRGTLS